MSFFSDDDVVVYRDPRGLCDFYNDSRHFNIGARGRRITRGMIVHDAIAGPYRNENKQEIVY
jgi:hypothetical protein